jgi:hypothetical protein
VDISGTIATAAMSLDHGTDRFTDLFLLAEEDGRWLIANKAYHREVTRRDDPSPASP